MYKEKKQTKKKKSFDYLKISNRFLGLLILVSGVLYLGGTNDLAIKHFVVKDNKLKLYKLQDENRQLENQVMALSSFTSVDKKVAQLGMVKIDQIDYINLNPVVAKR